VPAAPPGRVEEYLWGDNDAPEDRDPVGVWRYAALGVPVAGGLHGLLHTVTSSTLPRHQRMVAGVTAAGYLTGGIYAVVVPSDLGTFVQNHWKKTLGLCWLPLAVTFVSGDGDSPLGLLAVAGVGATAAVYGRERGTMAAASASAWWVTQNLVFGGWRALRNDHSRDLPGRWWQRSRRRAFERRYLIPVTSMFAASSAASKLTTAAYNARNFDLILTDARMQRDALRAYRDALGEALRDASVALRRAAAEPNFDPGSGEPALVHSDRREVLLQAAGRLHEWRAVLQALDAGDTTARTAIAGLLAVFPPLDPAADRIELEELADWADEPLSNLVAPAVGGLFGAALVAGVANALRHGHDPTKGRALRAIRVTATETDSKRLRVEVLAQIEHPESDCGSRPSFPNAKRGMGLRNLAEEVERLGGELGNGWLEPTAERPAVDRYLLAVELPGRGFSARAASDSEDLHELVAGRVLRQIDVGLRAVIEIFSLLALLRTAPVLHKGPWKRRVRAAAPVAVSGLYVGMDHTDKLAGNEGRTLAVLSSGAMLLAPANLWVPLAGWATVALTRYGLRTTPWRLAAATAGPALATVAGLRHRDEHPREPILAACVCLVAPGASWLTLTRGTRHFAKVERALDEDLAIVEQTLALADTFRKAHSPTEPMRILADQLGSPETSELLHRSLNAMSAAINHLPSRQRVPDLMDDLARIVRRRVWPATVVRSYDSPALSMVLPEQISGVAFRRGSLRIMDAVAREAMRRQMGVWRGFQEARSLRVHFYCPPASRTIICEITETEPPEVRFALGDRLLKWWDERRAGHERSPRKAARTQLIGDIERFGGELRAWDPDRHTIKFALPSSAVPARRGR
jgi:hypothetical protein